MNKKFKYFQGLSRMRKNSVNIIEETNPIKFNDNTIAGLACTTVLGLGGLW